MGLIAGLFILLMCNTINSLDTKESWTNNVRTMLMNPPKKVSNTLSPSLRRSLLNTQEAVDYTKKTGSIDGFLNGLVMTTESITLFGVKKYGTNATAFCAGLYAQHVHRIPLKQVQIVAFQPSKSIAPPQYRMGLSIPSFWTRPGNKWKTLQIYGCYEGEDVLKLIPMRISRDEFRRIDDYIEIQLVRFKEKYPASKTHHFRGMALVLDDKWNNAYLMQRKGRAELQIHVQQREKVEPITRKCNVSLGYDQPCCLWPFTLDVRTIYLKLAKKNDMEIMPFTYNQCIGKASSGKVTMPFIPEPHTELLRAGNMGRRLLTPVSDPVCRATKLSDAAVHFRNTNNPNEKGHLVLKNIHAESCTVFD